MNSKHTRVLLQLLSTTCVLLVSVNCTSQPPRTLDATCDEATEDNGVELKLTGVSGEGKQLSYSRRIVTNEDGSFTVDTVVMADGQLVMSGKTSGDPDRDRIEVEVEYGPLVPGIRSARTVVKDGMVSGNIGGRAIVATALDETDPSSLRFQDGNAVPDLGMDPDLEDAVRELMTAAGAAGQHCNGPLSSGARGSTAAVRSPSGNPDTGHDSDPQFSTGCVACWGGCSAGAAACIGGASVGCAAALFCWAKCEAIAVAACGVAYWGCLEGCNASGSPCCPVSCGEVACCESGETCLNAQIGLCCSEGKSPCAGEECCGSTEVCIDSGPAAGTCCEPENLCGDTCCAAGDSCIEEESLCCGADTIPCVDKCCETDGCIEDGPDAGTCCESQNICGNACCDELDSCVESLSLCCGFNSPACGNQCCAFGESCLGGNLCCPNDRACNGVCCPEGSGCNATTGDCVACASATDKYCAESDSCCPITKVCSPVAGVCCEPGEIYCDGACRPFGECIQ